ncbi:hypothetical protein PRIPAC_76048 [Pristionchus pacificus]|uniref:G protein-coupled receptor n=1 Tax=Pristionchus pacificus TaxID=54126 RepID=A0A2A6C8Z3_PRIPA|nr:hypothetical protein PRIPAC_76048 [Pristionchus pacificus]|eukprot:PDM74672.1 G protein-coupled receptor [Pristionchus pacificus]
MLTPQDTLHLVCIWVLDGSAILCNLLLIIVIILRIVQDREGSMIFVFLGPCTLINEELCRFCQGLHINLVQHSALVLLLSFAYRLYILGGDVFKVRRTIRPIHVWFACLLSLTMMAIPIAAYYFEQTSVAPEMITKLRLKGYTAANYNIFGSTRAILLDALGVLLSPTVMMTLIFIARHRLLLKIEKAKPTEKRLHVSIARPSSDCLRARVRLTICGPQLDHLLDVTSPHRTMRGLWLLSEGTHALYQSIIEKATALTYQLLLPCGVASAAVFWLLDVYEIWSSEFSERVIMLTCSIFSLASPLINFTVLPPYREIFQRSKKPNSITSHAKPFTQQ